MKLLFQDENSIPLNNFLKVYLPPAVIFFFLLIVFPLANAEEIDITILWFIVPGVFLIIYHGILWYNYSKRYLSSLQIGDNKVVMEVIGMNGKKESVAEEISTDFTIELKESLWSFNTIGISNIYIVFHNKDKVLHKQYPVGNWDTNELKRIAKEFKSLGVKVKSAIPI